MKKTWMISAFTIAGALAATQQVQAGNYGMAGCGLGAMFLKDNTMGPQILAVILNNIIFPQTTYISTGTLECDNTPATTAGLFISINRLALQTDIARGQGETLASYGNLMGCSDTARLGGFLKTNYSVIFPDVERSSSEIHSTIEQTIRQDQALAQSCGLAG